MKSPQSSHYENKQKNNWRIAYAWRRLSDILSVCRQSFIETHRSRFSF